MRAVDTNVLVRLATRDDTQQTAAAEAFIATALPLSPPYSGYPEFLTTNSPS
jgi:predicted nucleic-acid-binding protein